MVKRKKAPRSSGAATAEDAAAAGGVEVAQPARRKRRLRRAAAKAEAAAGKEDIADAGDEDEDEDEAEDEEDSEDSGGAGKSASHSADDVLEIDFNFREPDELDFHAVKDLLKNGTWEFAADLNFTELADSLVGQGNIGTIIKSSSPGAKDDDEETSCGLLTALNLRQFKHLSWVKKVEETIMAKARKHGSSQAASSLEAVLGRQGKDAEIGLLISERFVNLPSELLSPLHKALKEDIEWSCSTPECPADERPFYFFTHFLSVVKCAASSSSAAAPSKKRRKSGHAPGAESDDKAQIGGLTFPHEEMVPYIKRADFWFSFPVGVSSSADGQKKGPKAPPEHRAVFVIARKAFEQVVAEMRPAAKAAASASKG